MKRKKTLILLATGVVILATGSLFFLLRESEPIKIGVILPLTGLAGTGGQSALTGIQFALDDINAQGGVNGRPLEIVVKDGKLDPEAETEAFMSIEESTRPLFYIVLKDNLSEGSPALKGDTGVVLINLIVVGELSPEDVWSFNYGLDIEDENAPIIELVQDLDVKKLGVIYQDDDFSLGHANQLRKDVEGLGREVLTERVGYEQTNYLEEIRALKETDALYFIGFDQYVSNLLRQMRDQGYGGKFFTLSSLTEPVSSAFPPDEEVYIGAPALHNPRFIFGKEVSERYEARYGKPIGMSAGFGYDVIRLMSELLEGEALTRGQVRDVLERGFNYSGLFGGVHLTPENRHASFRLFPARATDGELEYLR